MLYCLRKNREENHYESKLQITKIFRSVAIGIIVIVLFGLLGDLRSGKDAMENIAGISDDYPSFLPSGFICLCN